MKKILFLFSLLTSSSLLATPVNMACVTEYPTTSFIAMTDGDTINFRLFHHNGVQFMPIWSNVITPNDLPMLNEVAQVLSDLGTDLNFSMPVDSCEVQDGFLINCFGNQPAIDINGHKVALWSVYTKQDTETSFAGEFSNVWTSMAIDVDGKSYYLPMKYSEFECYKDFNGSGIKKYIKSKKLFL
ncbi:MAG: hypothetical protein H7177_12715 [Rhizobacter sp.]|nr:hypothetical protein [Bacteriovorax sp.]